MAVKLNNSTCKALIEDIWTKVLILITGNNMEKIFFEASFLVLFVWFHFNWVLIVGGDETNRSLGLSQVLQRPLVRGIYRGEKASGLWEPTVLYRVTALYGTPDRGSTAQAIWILRKGSKGWV